MKNDPNKILAFIGAGNMASSLFGGLIKQGFDPQKLRVSDPDQNQLDKAAILGVKTYKENSACLKDAKFIVICVKPQLAKNVCNALDLSKGQVLVSIAAGITISNLETWLPAGQPIIRCMPNTPALIQQGITALYANNHTTDKQKREAEQILTAIGQTLWVDEEQKIDIVTAISGSGPAYFFYLIEQMIEAGKELGISEAEATKLVLQTALGSALLAVAEGQDPPRVLREKVTSPGGTTHSAIETFKTHKLDEILKLGVKNASNRSAELSREFGEPI